MAELTTFLHSLLFHFLRASHIPFVSSQYLLLVIISHFRLDGWGQVNISITTGVALMAELTTFLHSLLFHFLRASHIPFVSSQYLLLVIISNFRLDGWGQVNISITTGVALMAELTTFLHSLLFHFLRASHIPFVSSQYLLPVIISNFRLDGWGQVNISITTGVALTAELTTVRVACTTTALTNQNIVTVMRDLIKRR